MVEDKVSVDALSVDEVQQRLPDIVETLRRDGGRVDIVLDGQPVVSLVRTAELGQTDLVEEPPPKKRAPRRRGPKPRLQHAYKREPRVTED